MPIRDPGRSTLFPLVDLDSVQGNRGRFIAIGAALMVLGIAAVLLPFVASLATTIAVGWLMIVAGVVEGYHALRSQRWTGASWELASGVVQVVAGAFVVAFPIAGKVALTLILALYFACEGIIKIIRAVQHRSVVAPGWLVFDGILSLALGALILLRLPSSAVWAIGLLVGINLLFSGMSMLLIATVGRPAARA